jgi:hypothetical protein
MIVISQTVKEPGGGSIPELAHRSGNGVPG